MDLGAGSGNDLRYLQAGRQPGSFLAWQSRRPFATEARLQVFNLCVCLAWNQTVSRGPRRSPRLLGSCFAAPMLYSLWKRWTHEAQDVAAEFGVQIDISFAADISEACIGHGV